MNLNLINWLIFLGLFVGLISMSFLLRRFVKGVADFLVAGRNVGRYLGLESDSMAGLGAITILAMWQMNYKSGFVGQWWYLLVPLAATVVALTGWGIYRFRQTRSMTLGQLIEMRYDKKTRIFFGILAYAAGVLNMGIFPAAGAGFFVYYCGLPPVINLGFIQFPTMVLIMIILVGAAVIICYNGGQVTLVVTNFVQALFVNTMLVVIMISIYRMFNWEQFATTFQSAENAQALLHPFRGEGAEGFDKRFFLIGIFWMTYWVISWQPNSLVTSSAKNAHEAKMMRVMVEIKKLVYVGLGIGFLPLAVFVLMHHPDFADKASEVNQALGSIDNEQFRSQMLTPAALQFIMPGGLLGAFAGVVLFAFLSTHTSYLLAWGGLLIQDVVIPLRGGKALEPQRHMMLIRLSVVLVAVFIVLFSTFFNQIDNIYMFLDLTGGIFLSSAGVVLLGGLYWKKGNVPAAWATMLTGASLSIAGFVSRIFHPDFLDGRVISFYVTLISIAVYIIVSYISKGSDVDLDEVLNRKKQQEQDSLQKRKWYQFGPEVPKSDRILIPCLFGLIILYVTVFIGCWIYNSIVDVPVEKWVKFWHVYVYTFFSLGAAFLLWVVIGGVRDLVRLFRNLRTQKENIRDDGSVEGHHAAG